MPGAALVTGGTGFVGGGVVRALVERGWDVIALTRTEAGAGALASAGARPALGDVAEPDAILRGAVGCEVVFHAAGLNASCLRDPSPLVRINVEGTRNVLEAAARAGVRRFVHTSSAAAIGEPAGDVGREDTAHRGWFLTAYERSKFQAERLVLELGPELGLEVVCVDPSSVQGPGRATGTARLLLAAARGRLPLAFDAWLSFVDADDCALGHVRAAERGRPGERYILSGASIRVRQALDVLRGVTGRPTRTWFVPRRSVLPAAAVVEAAARAVGRTPPVCREVVRAGLHGHRFDGSRATRELGLVYTPLVETLRRTVDWFVAQGLLGDGIEGRRAHGSAYDGDVGVEPTRPGTRTRRWRSP
ncbi:MAG TPA: NAD-dependent epimerase/dehydratase family protein [Actinomycetota bacterium]